MADRAGGPNPPAPVNGGEFLLQLLRRPPQSLPPELPPAAAAASPLPIVDRLGRGRHRYDDPGVSAVGHEIPFSPHNFSDIGRPQLPPWLFPPPQQQQHHGSGFSPPGFSPPRFSLPQFSPPGYSRPEYQQGGRSGGGNRQQMFQGEVQQLGFTSGGGDRGRNFRAGDRIRMARSDLSAFPGRGQVEVGNVQRKMVASEQDGKFVNGQVVDVTGFSEFSRNSQGNHPHIERGEGFSSLMGDQRRNDAPVRRTIVEHRRPPGFLSRPKGPAHQVWGNAGAGKQNGNHGVVNGEELRKKDSRPPMTHYVKRQTLQRQFHVDGEIEYGRHSVENRRNHALEPQIEKLGDDLNCENDGGEGISRGKELINEDVIEVLNSFSKFTLQDSLQLKQHADSLTVVEEHVEKNEVQVNGSRSKDFRSDFSRGQNVSSQRRRMRRRAMECRRDIRRLSPSFLLIYESLVPPEEEVAKQKQLLLLLKKLVNKEWPKAELHLYGSCANSFGVSNSDIDICLAIDDTEMSKPEILLRLADVLQSGNLQNVQALTRARVPIVKLMDPVTGISCDICINNLLAVVNTKLLRDYARLDDRLRQLAFLVKHWAKSRDVNETYQGTLSSYAYVLMCIHFLQQRRPAILPCLQGMEATYVVTVDDVECGYFDKVDKLCNFGARNMESVAELLWGFFNYWAFQHDYANDVISVRTGAIISKHSKDWTRRIGNDRHLICIEDPFEISHDLGRVVDKRSIRILREEFERAADVLQYDSNPCATLFERYVRKTTQEQELV